MTSVVAIDPGPSISAYAVLEDGWPVLIGIDENDRVMSDLQYVALKWSEAELAREMVACYGMPVGAEVFETCVWVGRFHESWKQKQPASAVHYVFRKDVKMNLCQNMRAKDPNIRQALIDRFGGKEKGIGNKKSPGPLYGAKRDIWSAIAVAVTHIDAENSNGRLGAESDSPRGKSKVGTGR